MRARSSIPYMVVLEKIRERCVRKGHENKPKKHNNNNRQKKKNTEKHSYAILQFITCYMLQNYENKKKKKLKKKKT